MDEIVRFETSYVEPYPLHVVGEASYKGNIESVIDYLPEEGINDDDFAAYLILEDKNIYDPMAVKIEIAEKTVGYLSRSNARLYRQRLAEFGKTGAIGSCYASIRGGRMNDYGETSDFGIRLDIDLSRPLKKYVPFPFPPRKSSSIEPEQTSPTLPTEIKPVDISQASSSSKSIFNSIKSIFGKKKS
jgi:hypothetical protein